MYYKVGIGIDGLYLKDFRKNWCIIENLVVLKILIIIQGRNTYNTYSAIIIYTQWY